MKIIKEKLPDKNGFISVLDVGDYEYVNPIEKMEEITVLFFVNMDMQALTLKPELLSPLKGMPNIADIIYKVALKRALKYWQEQYEKDRAIIVPDRLIELLQCAKKSDQISLLKAVHLNGSTLMALVYRAWEEFGYTYSMYTAEHYPAGLEARKMPRMAKIADHNEVEIFGDTPLSPGQIRSAIKQRTVTIARVLDKGDIWHCFYYTYKSVNGEETGGIPHVHYISNAWGIPRTQVIAEIKKGKYSLPSTPHIPYSRRE